MFIVVAGFVFQTAPRVHCKVSRWSSWKPCSVTCGRGVQLRGRAVIKKEMNDGIPCPHLLESRPCIQPNCSGRWKRDLDTTFDTWVVNRSKTFTLWKPNSNATHVFTCKGSYPDSQHNRTIFNSVSGECPELLWASALLRFGDWLKSSRHLLNLSAAKP